MTTEAPRPKTRKQSIPPSGYSQRLVLRNLPLVRYVLRSLAIHLPPSVDREDLVEAGFIGLIDASRKFDPDRGVKFHTYAITRIRGSMLDELRAQDWLPRTARNELARLNRTTHTLHQQLGRRPTAEDIAKAMDCSVPYVRKFQAVARSDVRVSLHHSSDSSDALNPGIPEPSSAQIDPRDVVEFDEQKDILRAAIDGLPEHERTVIEMYYYGKNLLREIGERLGLSDSRIWQIHRAALERLRYAVKRQELPSGL